MAEINFVPQVSYTSRDYTSIREDLLELIPLYAPEWTSRNPADFGIVLLELFAYVGDLLNYNIDRSTNESFITTASQRNSVLQIAALLGYIPTQRTAAAVSLTFQNSTNAAITVPALTQVATSSTLNGETAQIIFETNSAIIVPAKVGTTNGSNTVVATQGESIFDELVGTSTGLAFQEFTLEDSPVIESSVSVTVNGIPFNQVSYLIDYAGSDPVFIVSTDADGVTSITFGDNVSGRIPPSSAEIYASYRVGGGDEGNVPAASLNYIATNSVSGLSANNQAAAVGGSDEESTDSIRLNAPASLKSLNRAVSLLDYASLALQVTGIAKSIATADVFSSVTVYIALFGDRGIDGAGAPTTIFNTIANNLLEYYVDKAPPNTTVTILPPAYADVDIIVDITVGQEYKTSLVKAQVTTALTTLLDFDNVVFKDVIRLSDVLEAVNSVNGVLQITPVLLAKTADIKTAAISNKAVTSGVATLTTSAAHSFLIGDTVSVSGVDSVFNGRYVVTAVSSTTFSYNLTVTTVASTPVSPTGLANGVITSDVVCELNELPEVGTITVNASGGIAG
jgi:uncharacterized phage protein gp47/JayE